MWNMFPHLLFLEWNVKNFFWKTNINYEKLIFVTIHDVQLKYVKQLHTFVLSYCIWYNHCINADTNKIWIFPKSLYLENNFHTVIVQWECSFRYDSRYWTIVHTSLLLSDMMISFWCKLPNFASVLPYGLYISPYTRTCSYRFL